MKPKASHGQNVISMFGYKCETQFPAINEVEAYWEGLRMGRTVPMRSEIDPRGIERALEFTFILERIAPGLARFRLSGMHLNDLLGMEVVTVEGEQVGEVIEIYELRPADLLEIRGPEKTFMIPYISAMIQSVSVEDNRIVLDPPPGLLEV